MARLYGKTIWQDYMARLYGKTIWQDYGPAPLDLLWHVYGPAPLSLQAPLGKPLVLRAT